MEIQEINKRFGKNVEKREVEIKDKIQRIEGYLDEIKIFLGQKNLFGIECNYKYLGGAIKDLEILEAEKKAWTVAYNMTSDLDKEGKAL